MSFCRNCGNKLLDGARFCTNCGWNVDDNIPPETTEDIPEVTPQIMSGAEPEAIPETASPAGDMHNAENTGTNTNANVFEDNEDGLGQIMGKYGPTIDKFGRFYGILLLIAAVIIGFMDPAIIVIILSIAVIAGCIFCFERKYKRKGFTIAALIIAVFCLLSALLQAKKIGLFTMPSKSEASSVSEYAAEESDESIAEDTSEDEEENADETSDENKEDAEKESTEKAGDNDEKDSTENAEDQDTKDSTEADTDEDAKDSTEADTDKDETESIAEADGDGEDEAETSADGVDPELKAYLDSYEDFIDEYVVFLKKYTSDPGNAVSMLSEYSKFMEKYEDFEDKVDAYDTDNMSDADRHYYLEVTMRCSQKLLEAY